ncbi:MAG TPA: general stress protein [Propionibacteriaceae bacterium]|nr:general stress protein [Propionibacteriaceae bacterium]
MTQDPYARSVGGPTGRSASMFDLEYPRSVGVFDTYPAAQKAVDFLADNGFPVNNLAIVGTDLRTVERVLARRTWKTVLMQGATQGLSTAFILFFVLWLFIPGANVIGLLLAAFLFSILVSMIFAAIGYSLSRGQRDFTSVQQTVATRYEVLCEHKVAEQAQELLATMAPAAGF